MRATPTAAGGTGARRLLERVRRVVRTWAPVPLALRVVLLLTGGAALLVAPAGRLVVPGLVALVGAAGLLVAVARPDGPGPLVVVGAAATAWTVRYGVAAPPVDATLLLAATLAVHHQSAALAAALPMTASVEPAVLLRFAAYAMVVLTLSAAIAALALGVARPGGSVPLELAGLAAAVLLTAVPVLLRRALGRRG